MNPGVLLMVLSSMLIAVSATCYHLSSHQLVWSQPFKVLINKFFLAGIAISILTFLLNIIAYRYGDLSTLQPLLRLTIIWKLAIAHFYFKEVITPKIIFSVALILGGTLLITADL